MIFSDTIEITYGGTTRTVHGVVTFMDSEKVVNTLGGTNLFTSRLRIYLSPYGSAIPATGVTLSWKQFTNLIVEGMIEPHYIRGRLHHYECVARTV